VYRNVQKWSDKCGACQALGTASTLTTGEKQEEARAIILADRRVTIEEIAPQLGISQGSATSLVHDNLGFHKVSARWVPKHLTQEQRHNCLDICSHLLEWYNCKGGNFLNRIITGDETWIHHYEPETKRQRIQLKHTLSLTSNKFKSQSSVRKHMLTVFWDSQGPILQHYLEQGTMVTSVKYCDMLRNELGLAIHTKRRERLSQDDVLLHNNACPHTAAHTINTFQQLKWEVLKHSAHSPDLMPSNFHLSEPLEDALRGRQFADDDEVTEALHD
jgi:histone-lysine N-methyltransferase SETMAR